MTEKLMKFALEYLKDLNTTQAAIRAGYSKKTAYSIGWENLRKPEVKAFIDKELETAMGESKAAIKSKILDELKNIAFTDSGVELLRDKDGEVYDVRITDKLKALDMLGKYVAMFTDNIKVSVDQSVIEALKAKYENK